jgi:O-antigen/teichoic acid export membrane protein
MNLSIKKVIGNSFFFSIGVIFSKAIGIIMLPIYTHFLDSGSFGIATTVTGFVSTFCVVLTLSLRSALMRFYKEYTDEAQRQRFVGSIVSIIILNSFNVDAS